MDDLMQNIRMMVTVYKDSDGHNCHESLLRSWHILGYVKRFLENHQRVDGSILLDIIRHLENNEG